MKIINIMSTKRRWSVTAAVVALPFFLFMAGGAKALEPPNAQGTGEQIDFELKLLGKYLFFDKISLPSRQSCASCHTPDAGWTNGTSGINQKQVAVTGANPHTVGTLKPPSNAYASFVPNFAIGGFGPVGGNFWNGRAQGDAVASITGILDGFDGTSPNGLDYTKYLGPTADQAHASPFTNLVEQGLPNKVAVCELVKSAKYAPLYAIAYPGAEIDCTGSPEDGAVAITFGRFAVALAAYQSAKTEVNVFGSKRDDALKDDSDGKFPLDDFTDQENLGHDLFYNLTSDLNTNGVRGNCATFCHRSGLRDGTSPDERYTGDGYFNIGTPFNVEIPITPGTPDRNPGVAATTGDDDNLGLHKTPTLRNVDKRRGAGFKKAYTHNGWFKSLESIVHFYNTRDIKSACEDLGIVQATETEALANDCWPAAEFPDTQSGFLGNLGLTADEEAALVAYLKTLSDIPTAKAPEPFSQKKLDNGQLR